MPAFSTCIRRLLFASSASLLISGGFVIAEAPAIDGLFPAGVERGSTTTVTLIGKPGSEPLETWTSRDDIVFAPTDKPSEWTLTAALDAPAGLGWVRFYNTEGASQLQPVVVGQLPELNEVEPNDAVAGAHEMTSLPTLVNGQLSQSGDVDTFAVDLAAGQTLIASVDAHRLLGSPMDGVLQLLSPRGFVLEQNDDHHGNDPRIVFSAKQPGRYFLRMFAFPANPNSTIRFSSSAKYVYRLTLTTGPFVNHVVPLAISPDSPSQPAARGWNLPEEGLQLIPIRGDRWSHFTLNAPSNLVVSRLPLFEGPALLEDVLRAETEPQPLAIPVSVTGTVAQPEETDVYTFSGRKGHRVLITTESQPFDSPLDPLLQVFGPDGKLLKEADDVDRSIADARLALTLPSDGDYRVEVSDRFGHGDEWSVYHLAIVDDEPRYELTLPDKPLTVEAGKSLDVAVTVNRLAGFDEEVVIRMHGLPPGVQAREARSLASGDSAKKVTLKLSADSGVLFSGPVHVIGSVDDGASVRATSAAPSAGLRIDSQWLTVTAAEE